jgi:transcriptional regulator GlxA family with amidase domain
MRIALITFDGFTDIDVVLPWDLLHRAREPSWEVRILGTSDHHVSATGLPIPTHGRLEDAADADVVLVSSGAGARLLATEPHEVHRLGLDESRQMIGSMCSGALVLAAAGLLQGRTATTYPTAVEDLRAFGVDVVEKPFVRHGNVATAAGCLAAQDLVGWVIETHLGAERRNEVLRSIQPVGAGLTHADAATVARTYAPAV